MTTCRHSPQESPVGSEPEWILQSWRAATADSAQTNEADVSTQIAQISRAYDLWKSNFGVLPEQAVYKHIGDELKYCGLDEEQNMSKNQSASESVYDGTTHNDIFQTVQDALIGHEEGRLGRLIDDWCEELAFALFPEFHYRALGDVHTSIYFVMDRQLLSHLRWRCRRATRRENVKAVRIPIP